MPSSYTTSLRLTLPATGELAGSWGSTVNTGITELLDAAVAGTASISTWGGAGVAYTLSNNSGTADEARKMFIVATGTPGEAKNVICPAVSKFYVFRNDTTGGFALTLKTSSGTGISVPAGQYKFLYCDGTNVVEAFNSAGALTLSGALTVNGTTTLASNPTLSAGTANQVQYLNASKVLTGSANLTFDGTTLTGAGFSGPLNGTVGATTPSTGAFTTLSASSTVSGTGFTNLFASPPAIGSTAANTGSFTTLSASGNVTLSGGTANGVVYLNGSKVLTTGSALTFDGTKLLASASSSTTGEFKATSSTAQIFSLVASNDAGTSIGLGVFGSAAGTFGTVSAGTPYLATSAATMVQNVQNASGAFVWGIGATPFEQMRLNTTGLGIGTSSPWSQLTVGAGGTANPASTVSFHKGTVSEYRLKLTSSLFNSDGAWLGLGFGYSDNYMKAAIIAEAKDVNARTNLHFALNDAASSANASLSDSKMVLTYTGNLGIGTSSPSSTLHVQRASYGVTAIFQAQDGTGNPRLAVYGSSSGTTIQNTWSSGASNLIFANGGAVGSGTEVARFDSSGNLGLGVTPSAWNSSFRAIQLGGGASFWNGGAGVASTFVGNNYFLNASGNRVYIANGTAAEYAQLTTGAHVWYTAPSGTAGNAITFTQALTLDANRNLALNTTSVGTSAVGALSIGSGTEPSSGPADTVQLYSVDRSAGNTIPAFYCEGTGVTNAGITNTTVTHKIAMKINGTVYYLLATTNAT